LEIDSAKYKEELVNMTGSSCLMALVSFNAILLNYQFIKDQKLASIG
jgi:hypothetical protein